MIAAPMPASAATDPESRRLIEDATRARNWKRFGPYLADRQWGTVREDYSATGECWDYFPHDHARSRAYRWGEDGLLGISDRQCRLCFALALWNERDAILKERLFGLSGPEGNHGEDVKELYYFLDATPTHSYGRALYKYPQGAFPYERLVQHGRGKGDPEYELVDTGVFDDQRYFDVFVEYGKASPDDQLIRFTVCNRGPEPAPLHLLPTLWFRNVWSWGRTGEGYGPRPRISRRSERAVETGHAALGSLVLEIFRSVPWPFTENETNFERLFAIGNSSPHVKDAFHECVVQGRRDRVNPAGEGSKAAAWCRLEVPAGGEAVVRLRLRPQEEGGERGDAFADFDSVMAHRREEADRFYAGRLRAVAEADRPLVRQAYAGLLWSKQFYHYDVGAWLEGDPSQPAPPPERARVRNGGWRHLYNRDVLSMPDKWEYPWYGAWDLGFHMLPFARIDPAFAKDQL